MTWLRRVRPVLYLLGVLLIGVINNLLTLAQVPSFYVQASTGAVIIVAAVLTTVASRRSSGVRTRT